MKPTVTWVLGADDAYMEIKGGTIAEGRFFTQGELHGAEVAVLELELARAGRSQPRLRRQITLR